MSEIKVGVLLPRSSLYRLMGSDLLTGIRSGLKRMGIDNVSFCTESIGYGGEQEEVHAKAEKMLLEQDPRMVIAFIDHFAAAKIEPLFEAMNKILLVVEPGGHVPENWVFSPVRFSITLQAALGSRCTARMAAESGAKKNIFATSFYEGGYLSCYSFIRGLEKAGGSVYFHDVIPYKLEAYSSANLENAISHIQPDAVLAQFSAEAGEIFMRSFSQAGLNTKMYASPFMLEEEWLSNIPFLIEGVKGCTSWARDLDNPENAAFMEAVKASTGREANVFHLLGWEAAAFIDLYIKESKNTRDIQTIVKAIEKAELVSPRGRLVIDPSVHYFFSPMYAAEIVKNESNGNCRLQLYGEVEFVEEERRYFIEELPSGVISRWTNTYLCI